MAGERYSKAVHLLKILLPLVALGLLSTVFLVSRDDFKGLDRIISYSDADLIKLSQGLRLSNPRFTGSTENGEPFVIKAEWAQPDKPSPSRIELHKIEAMLDMPGEREVHLVAERGDLTTQDQIVRLEGGVIVTTSDGYEATAEVAFADMRARTLTIPGEVLASGPLGTLKAGTMRVTRTDPKVQSPQDEYIWFENGVQLTYIPNGGSVSEQ